MNDTSLVDTKGACRYLKRFQDYDDLKLATTNRLLRKNTWQASVRVYLANLIGTGTITMPYAFMKLGFIPGMFLSIGTGLMSLYTSILLSCVVIECPDAHTMGDLVGKLGPKWLSNTIYSTIYSSIFLFFAYYLLVCSEAIQDIQEMCLATATLILGLFLFPFAQMRTMGDLSKLGFFSLSLVLMCCFICLWEASIFTPYVKTNTFTECTFWDFLKAFTAMIFSSSGSATFTEIAFEMQDIRESLKVIWVSHLIIIVFYTTFGALGYWLAGSLVPEYFLDVMERSTLKKVVSAAFVVHILFNILVNVQVEVRAAQKKLFPDSVDAIYLSGVGYWRARGEWLILSILYFTAGFLVMNTVPYFSQFVEFLGSIFVPLHNITIPMYLYWKLLESRNEAPPKILYIVYLGLTLLFFVVTIFGTYDAVYGWLKQSGDIWSCI